VFDEPPVLVNRNDPRQAAGIVGTHEVTRERRPVDGDAGIGSGQPRAPLDRGPSRRMEPRPARTDGNIPQEAGCALGPEDPHDAPFQALAVEGAILVFLDEFCDEVLVEIVHGAPRMMALVEYTHPCELLYYYTIRRSRRPCCGE